MKRILVLSDEHCGHCVGLTPPSYQVTPARDAPRYLKKRAEQRRVLWMWFRDEIRSVGQFDILLNNGDAIEGRGEKTGGTELLVLDRDEQCDMAIAVIKEATYHVRRAPKIFMTYGTPYHTGNYEDFENDVAEGVGAEKIENEGHYCIEGWNIVAKHHIGNTNSIVSRKTAAASAQAKQALWADRKQQPRAHLIIRSHIHRAEDVSSPGENVRIIVTPGLQGLGSKYGARRCDGLPVDFGFAVVNVQGKTSKQEACLGVEWHIAPLTLQAADVTRIS